MRGLQSWDTGSPASPRTEGTEEIDGIYHVYCVAYGEKCDCRSTSTGVSQARFPGKRA